jgi:hypothetical protein
MSILLVVDTVRLYLVIAVATAAVVGVAAAAAAVVVASSKDVVVALQLGLHLLKMLLLRCSWGCCC